MRKAPKIPALGMWWYGGRPVTVHHVTQDYQGQLFAHVSMKDRETLEVSQAVVLYESLSTPPSRALWQ